MALDGLRRTSAASNGHLRNVDACLAFEHTQVNVRLQRVDWGGFNPNTRPGCASFTNEHQPLQMFSFEPSLTTLSGGGWRLHFRSRAERWPSGLRRRS